MLSASVSLSTPLVTSPLFNLVFKSPLIAADIISGVIIYSIARRISDEEIAEKATIFWLINPLTIWVSSVIGQSDPLLVMFIFLALWCSINNEWALAGSFFALSVFSKGYSLPIGVFFGVYLFFMGLLSSEKQPISSRFSDLIRFGSASAIVAILLLVPMILGNGSAVFLRRFQSNISWGGISPFVLKNLSGIMNSTEGVVFTWIVPSIEIIHSLRLEYIAGIVLCVALVTAYKGRFDEEEVRSVCIILGIAAQSYFCIFLLGRVNPQYVLLPLATFTLIYAVIEQRSRFLWLLTMTSVLVTFFGVSVVSWQYDVIPLAVFTEILDIGDLVESIISDWSGTGLITNYSFKDRAVIFGFPAWVTITCCFVMVLSKIFERGSTHQ